jgi:DNA ligase-1
MVRREFMMLAKTQKDEDVTGWYMSEKLDGTRCFWDGGVSRGRPTIEVPWANIYHPKTGEKKAKIKPIASGLWSRSGNPIMAPDWFLNQLPPILMDGELCLGREDFQTLRSAVAKHEPVDEEWKDVQYAVFGTPSFDQVFKTGKVNCPQMVREIDMEACKAYYDKVGGDTSCHANSFDEELCILQDALCHQVMDNVHLHQQIRIENKEHVQDVYDILVSEGAEGIMFRKADSKWEPKRTSTLLKCKPQEDDESVVVGFVSGKGKLEGLIGAIITNYKGKRLELGGFTDEERQFSVPMEAEYAAKYPGTVMPSTFQGKHIEVGQVVTFKYSGMTDDGIPKIARYWRNRT